MSFSIDSLEQDVSSSWNSISSAGAPAVIAGVENYAASQLQQDANANQAASQAAVQQITSNSAPATGVMASIQSVFKNIAAGTVFKQYGALIIIGGIAAIFVIRRI